MRGADPQQNAMFSYLTLEQRIPADHPLRAIRALTDRALKRIDGELDKLYSAIGRQSVPPGFAAGGLVPSAGGHGR